MPHPATVKPADPPPVRVLLNPPEAAAALAMSERRLWDLTRPRGPIPSVRNGRRVLYRVAALERYAAALEESFCAADPPRPR